MSRPVPAGPTAGRGRLPVPTRDRRPALAALALLLVVVGALGAALVVYRSGQRVDVLISTHEIRPGAQVTAADFTTARVSNDGGQTIPANAEARFIGSYAVIDIPNQTLLNAKMFLPNALPTNSVIIGVTVNQVDRPAAPISTGDVVQVYIVPSGSGSSSTSGPVGGLGSGAAVLAPTPTAEQKPVAGLESGLLFIQSARVVGVSTSSSSSPTGSQTESVSLLVSTDIAPQLTTYERYARIALGLLPPGSKPSPDLQGIGS